jgi:steroid delta-isomerase-like uncharacterized protein
MATAIKIIHAATLAACFVLAVPAPALETSPAKATRAKSSPQAVLRAYVSAWNRHDFAAFDTLVAPNGFHEDAALQSRAVGPAKVKNLLRDMLKAEPDLNWHLTTVIASGPIVAAEWTWTGTYTGDSPNGPVAGKPISGRGATIAVIENGQIKRLTDYYDSASYFPKTPDGRQ